MGKVFIIVSTIILLLVVIQRNTSNNIRLFKRLKNIIFENKKCINFLSVL